MLIANKYPPTLVSHFLPNFVIFFPIYKEVKAPLIGNKEIINPITVMSQPFSKAISGKYVLGIKQEEKLKNIKMT